MDKQLQQAVAALIEKSLKAFESGADFMAAQLPDVVQQLLMWHMALSATKAAAAVLLFVVLVIATRRGYKAAETYKRYGDAWLAFILCGTLGWTIWAIAVGALWNLTWLQIWVAPKIFLIEYAARMVTK